MEYFNKDGKEKQKKIPAATTDWIMGSDGNTYYKAIDGKWYDIKTGKIRE
jgi:hypothetical protein